jgi:hypothetical protein
MAKIVNSVAAKAFAEGKTQAKQVQLSGEVLDKLRIYRHHLAMGTTDPIKFDRICTASPSRLIEGLLDDAIINRTGEKNA